MESKDSRLLNHFAPLRTITYYVDPLGRRIRKAVNGSMVQGFLWLDELHPIAELGANGGIVAKFIYADKANVPSVMYKIGYEYRIITDHLGSVRMVVDNNSGAILQQLDYDPSGQVIVDTNPGFQPFGYAGGLYDRDTGLVRFGRRDYDPAVGRWTSKDPIGFAGGLNLYGYVVQDPVNGIDPDGEAAVYINYDYYPVETGFGKLPLGHAGVLTIDEDTGVTKYYEYGRYDAAQCGIGRKASKIPNVKIVDGSPTSESLQKVYDHLSRNYGKGSHVTATYFANADEYRVIEFAEQRVRESSNPDRQCYSVFSRNCKTFAQDAIDAGR